MTKLKPRVGSKWTSQNPVDKEKHFVIIDITHQTTPSPQCLMEAVLTKKRGTLPLASLLDPKQWLPGWN